MGKVWTAICIVWWLVFVYAMLWRLPEFIDVVLQLSSTGWLALVVVACGWGVSCLLAGRSWFLLSLVVLLASLKQKLDFGLPQPTPVDMTGRVVLITGGNSGVGFASAEKFYGMGATVILACRNHTRCEAAVKLLQTQATTSPPPVVYAMQLDIASFQSVRQFANNFLSKFSSLHVLINNAGFAQAKAGALTAEGFELGLGSMHFGHFLLTSLLERVLKDTAKQSSSARVVNVASFGSQVAGAFGADFDPSLFEQDGEGDLRGEKIDSGSLLMYIRAKLANVLFTRELSKRWGREGIVSCSMHVGAVATNVWTTDEMPVSVQMAVNLWSSLFFRSSEQGARVILGCALQPGTMVQGKYLNGMGEVVQESSLAEPSNNDTLAARLWEVSEKVIQ